MNALQKKILEIFKIVQRILDKNKIDYYAIGGTCIGAVRHSGFIPWDDDLDIAVPIEKFDFMLKILKQELPIEFKVYTCNEIRNYRYIFAKIIDTRTTFIEKTEFQYPEAYKGVFIDIMPLGGIVKSKQFYIKQKIYFLLNMKKRIFEKAHTSLLKKVFSKFIYLLPVRYTYFSDKYMEFLRRYSVDGSDYVGYVWSRNVKRLTFPKDWFISSIELPFEDISIKCPVEYDAYLKQQFGDYMKLPAISEREPHHAALIRLDTTYMKYQEEPQKVLEDYNAGE